IQNADSIILKSPKGIHDFDRYFMLAYERKAEAFLELKNFQKAYVMADSAVYFAKIFNKQLTIYPLELLYKSAKALNKFNAALWAFEQMTTTRDSIFSVEKNKAIQELESKYNQSKNEQIINELSQQRQIYLLLIVVAIAIIIISIFYLRQQKLQHKQTIMETEQRLNRARMNPHFFFNTLASLQSFALTENDNKNLAANISKFSHIMRETLESTYKEYVTIEQEIDFLNEYLQLQTIRFPKRFQYRIQADDKLEIDALQIPSMILQPFVENAIEHGLKGLEEEGLIAIHFSENKEGLLIEINDNGNGFSIQNKTNGEHISRASQIVKDRIYLLNIKLKTRAGFILNNNENGKGVCVKIQLPLLYK
ncbi:MAG: sensor histidine kinase, partial [Chitinophagaceae bacterium]